MADKTFAEGIYFQKREKAPEWIVGSLSFKVPEAIAFLEKHRNNGGYVNIDIKESKGGKYYCELNTYTPGNKSETDNKEIPF